MQRNSYQIVILGGLDDRLTALESSVSDRAKDLGIDPSELAFLTEAESTRYVRGKPTVVIYYGNTAKTAPPFLAQLLSDSSRFSPHVVS